MLSPSVLDDPHCESFVAFMSVANAKAPTIPGISAMQLKQSVETHIDGLTQTQRVGFLAFVEAHVNRKRR